MLSYGVRAYVDVPYMLLVLSALLVETRKPRAGAPVLVLLGLAGLLRPEAWAFSGIYWVVLVVYSARSTPERSRRQLAQLALLAAAAPLIWVLSDLLVTGNAMWSLTNTKHTAEILGRETGIANVPEYIPRRIGEILRPVLLLGAALGGCCRSPGWASAPAGRRGRAARRARVCRDGNRRPADRYPLRVPGLGDPVPVLRRRRVRLECPAQGRQAPHCRGWRPAGSCSWHCSRRFRARCARPTTNCAIWPIRKIQDELLAMVHNKAIALKCGPVGVPNHAPIPLLALYLKARPGLIVSAEATRQKPNSRNTEATPIPRASKSKRTTSSTSGIRTCPCRSLPAS